jgi:hypothetical protein
MPKAAKKRRTTKRNNQLSRPKKAPAKAKATKKQQVKADYYDLVGQSDVSLKSKSTGSSIKLAKPPRNLKVADDWDVKAGDVISWSQGRPTETFFVTAEGTLLKNPDTSGSGYLTIPLSITSQFSDALDHFSAVLDGVGRDYVSSIELAPTDAFFAAHFSKKPLPASIQNRNDISYSYDPQEDVLYVTLASNPRQPQHFSLDSAKTDDIIQFISAENQPKAKFTVKYNFEGKETCSKAPRGIIGGLPAGWQCEQQGALMFGGDKIQGEWKCEGSEKTKEKARKAIEKHYKGLNVEIN